MLLPLSKCPSNRDFLSKLKFARANFRTLCFMLASKSTDFTLFNRDTGDIVEIQGLCFWLFFTQMGSLCTVIRWIQPKTKFQLLIEACNVVSSKWLGTNRDFCSEMNVSNLYPFNISRSWLESMRFSGHAANFRKFKRKFALKVTSEHKLLLLQRNKGEKVQKTCSA